MTVRDVLVQIGFLMVAAGAMLAVWALLSGQLQREPEPEVVEEDQPIEPAAARPRRPRPQRAQASARTRKPPQGKRRPSA